MGKSLKRFLRVRESMSSKILMQLIGNVDSYIINRAGNAKAKIEERFKKKISIRTKKIPKLLPNISLIPDEYGKLINLLGFGICKVCKERLTWYHLAKHSHLIRNPELVIQYKIQQWKQMKGIKDKNLRNMTEGALFIEKERWQFHISEVMKTVNDIISFPGAPVPLNK